MMLQTAVPEPATAHLDEGALHPALHSPVLDSVSFLSEVMGRFPTAISFAPGAPHRAFLDDLDLEASLDRFRHHLAATRGLSTAQANRLLYEYGPTKGIINDLVARALRLDEGIHAPDEAVVITAGCQEAVLVTLRTLFGRPGDVLAVPDPCFSGALGAARLLDIEVEPVAETAHGLDLDELDRLCAGLRAAGRRLRALYLTPSFANPSGTTLDLAARQRLLATAHREDFYILEDNVYGFTASGTDAYPALKSMPGGSRVVYLGSFAKVCLPGTRIGYLVADQLVQAPGTGRGTLLADRIAAVKSMVTLNTSPICQAIIGGILVAQGGSLAAANRRRADLYRRNLRLLLAGLDRHIPPGERNRLGVRWNTPSGGFFVRMTLPVPADLALLERSARRYSVLWTPMSYFHLRGGGTHDLRLSCSYLSPEDIEEGTRRLARLVSSVHDS
jgi:(S)-3,5-dihydroxyphenylglycine transaminase